MSQFSEKQWHAIVWTRSLCLYLEQTQASQNDVSQRIAAVFSKYLFESSHLTIQAVQKKLRRNMFSLLGNENRIVVNEFCNVVIDAIMDSRMHHPST